mmetsp:Transcript_23101/g.73941  ORF Transcript_23101/g.73941 Transcript_23101/m.73941 type:complete len:377 (+) Transcript_23101:1047-2177(+)
MRRRLRQPADGGGVGRREGEGADRRLVDAAVEEGPRPQLQVALLPDPLHARDVVHALERTDVRDGRRGALERAAGQQRGGRLRALAQARHPRHHELAAERARDADGVAQGCDVAIDQLEVRLETRRPLQRRDDGPAVARASGRRLVPLWRRRAGLRRREGEVTLVERLRPDRQHPRLAQPPVLCRVLWPALDESEVQHEAAARLCRLLHVEDVRRADLRDGDGVDAARPVAVVDDPPVLARRLERVEAAELLGVAARRADGAHQLVEGELVVDLRLALDLRHRIPPLGHHVDRRRPRTEEHDARVEPRRPGGARLVAAVAHVALARRAVRVVRHVEAIGAGEHIGVGHGAEQRVGRRNPRDVDVRDRDVATGAEQP